MKDYWRLIGVTTEDANDNQVRQAHFRTFRLYQGRKNSSTTAEQRVEAERIIDYLRRAQHNPDLPIPENLKHLLPSLPQPAAAPPKPKPVAQPAKPTEPEKPIDVEIFSDPNISEMARNILGTQPTEPQPEKMPVDEEVPPTKRFEPAKEPEQPVPAIDDIVEDDLVLEPILEPEQEEKQEPKSYVTKPLSTPSAPEQPPQPEQLPQLPQPLLPPEPQIPVMKPSGRQIVVGDVINCPDCEWEIITQTDSYCSGCGKSITSVAVPEELIIYISETGSYTKSFPVINNGLIPITIDAIEVIDIDAVVQPVGATVLGKNESLYVHLRVSEANPFGKRSGRLRFRYHGKPIEIPIQLKEPPDIWLSFPDVPNARTVPDGFLLRMPVSQRVIACRVNTNSENPLTITSITISPDSAAPGARPFTTAPFKVERNQPYQLQIENPSVTELTLTFRFEELGSRQFRLAISRVEVPNLIDRLDHYPIGEHAIILGSGLQEINLQIKNEQDAASGSGRGSAQKIALRGAPEWLTVNPSNIGQLGPGQSAVVRLSVNSSKIPGPRREHVRLALTYYDPQLECAQERSEPVQLPFEFIEPRRFNDWIAIDFGTSNSCAAMIDGTTFRSLTIDAETLNTNLQESPTCIQFVDELRKNYECGMSAYSKRFSGPRAIKATAWAFKPLLSRSTEPLPQTYLDILNGQPHTKTVDELIAIYGRALVESVKLRNAIVPRKAVVTYPVTFGKWQRERLASAFKAAGLEEVVTPINESVALAIHYAYLHREVFLKPAIFAVFDFGGGTTDMAIFQIHPSAAKDRSPELRLLDVGGVDVGGELLTFELARLIYEKLVPAPDRQRFAFPSNLEELSTSNSDLMRENYSHLADLAENVKRSFQSNPAIFGREIAKSLFDGSRYQAFKTEISSDEVEALLRQRIKQPIAALIEMISALQERGVITERKIDRIILGGNSSRMPLVTDMLAEALFEGDRSSVLIDTENMKFGVMKGALLYAVAPEALPFPIDQVNQTLPCRVGLLGAGYKFDLIFERGLVAGSDGTVVHRQIHLSHSQEFFRLYYYFGHDPNPKVLDNPRMKEYAIPCGPVSGKDVDAIFSLLPNGEGIEVTFRAGSDLEIKHIAPILGGI
jgi:hypothetical protein